MLIGLSVSLCIRDIAKGIVSEDEVDYIISGIHPTFELPMDATAQERLSHISKTIGNIAFKYEKTYWRHLPEARDIFFHMFNNGRILCPRERFGEAENIADGYWLVGGVKSRSPKPQVLPTVIELTQTLSACPSQWDGRTKDGEYVYIRYRWGYLSVDIAGKNIFDEQIGGPMDGVLGTSEMIGHLVFVVDFQLDFD